MTEVLAVGTSPGAIPDPELVGGKAANLVRMAGIGLRVPAAFVVTGAACREYFDRRALPPDLRGALAESVRQLEDATGLRFGDARRPLLVSVRSSPPVSMPGMLDTVLNVGLNESTVSGLIALTGNPWLAWDALRRLVHAYAGTVLHSETAALDRLVADGLSNAGARSLQELDGLTMRDLARESTDLVLRLAGRPFPVDPLEQLVGAVEAVLQSWQSPRARTYRQLNGLDESTGTAVLVQAMVFGNGGPQSGAGVGFTRNPATGDDALYLDFLFNAQGEDVVSGRYPVTDGEVLPAAMPAVWEELQAARRALERAFLDMQDFEFTIDEGTLYFLQTRAGKRTPWAAVQIATDLVHAGIIDSACALERLRPYDLDTIVRVAVRPGANDVAIARAVPASVGAVTGGIVFDAARAEALASERPVVLVRTDLTTDDVTGLSFAAGLLTTHGGRTSHAAVVARQMGKVCLVGCRDLRVDQAARECALGEHVLREGDTITLDGDAGLVYYGRVPIVSEHPHDAVATIRGWRG